MFKLFNNFAFIFSALLLANLSACSSGDDSKKSSSTEPPSGFFVDASVNALSYESKSYSGQTEYAGNFPFKEGETTTFSFKGLVLGSVIMKIDNPTITPLDLFNTTDINDQRVINVLVLLQTLDNDQNPENGISLPGFNDPNGANDYLSSLNLSSANFQSELQPILDSEFGTDTYVVVAEGDAISHFEETLDLLNGVPDFVSNTWIARSLYGDVFAEYVFNINGTLKVTEYEGCPGNLWAATKASLIVNCPDTNKLEFTWSLAGDVLSMSSEAFEDTCYVQFVKEEYITAVCNFFGSGLGNELIVFENTEAIRATDLVTKVSPTGAFAVYDGDTGECKNYYNFNNTTKYVSIQQNEGSDYICKYGSAGLIYPGEEVGQGTTESGADYNIYAYSLTSNQVNFASGLGKTCNPIYTQAFLSNYVHLMSCTQSVGPVFYEIWKTF